MVATSTTPGVACVEQGAIEQQGTRKTANNSRSGVVAAQRDGGGSTGVVLTKRGKPVKCLHCEKNHWVKDCPTATLQ